MARRLQHTNNNQTNTKINTTIVGLNDRRERQATMIGEKVGMELVGEIRFWVPKRSGTERLRTKDLKDRDPRVGGKRSACNGNRSAQAGKTRLEGTARPERSDTLTCFDRLDRERSLGFRTRLKEQMAKKVWQNDQLDWAKM